MDEEITGVYLPQSNDGLAIAMANSNSLLGIEDGQADL